MPTEVSHPRGQAMAERCIKRWLKPDAYAPPGFDHPAYDRMADQLIGAMNAVGHADSVEGITALTKALSLMLAQTLRLQDDAAVSRTCLDQSAWIENEVMALRKAMSPSVKKDH